MSEWVPESDWSKVNVGDRVRVERENGDCAEFEVARPSHVEDRLFSASNYYDKGSPWTLYVAPKPTPALPTEPGIYMDAEGDVWRVYKNGTLSIIGEGLPADPAEYAPFTRLESQTDTARKVLERVRAEWNRRPLRQQDFIGFAAEFGVTL